jgi:hypothetical protein
VDAAGFEPCDRSGVRRALRVDSDPYIINRNAPDLVILTAVLG